MSSIVKCLCCALVAVALAVATRAADTTAAEAAPVASTWIPSDPPNSPSGEAKGIFPGRVTWIRDARATLWDGMAGKWWEPGKIDEAVLAKMFSESLRGLTDASSDSEAWEKLFRHFNCTHGRGDRGWKPGESIAIKVNCNNTYQYDDVDNDIDQSPQATRALLRQLTAAGVAQKNIVVYDASIGWKVRALPDRIYGPLHAEFPEVRWVDGQGSNGREAPDWVEGAITFTSQETELGTFLPRCVVEAAYLIDFALLKGHEISGVTLCAKNHFGSVKFPQKEHGKYVAPMNRAIDDYSAYVDLMGSPSLGGKTVLYILDGLYAMQTNVGAPQDRDRWRRLFNGQWCASYFMSQDPVAIDSVGLDFLLAEFQGELGYSGAKQFPRGSAKNSDNYLLEAARGSNEKLGPYKPNGVAIGSLGVHEHWNNAVAKQYSRNLSHEGKGIELVALHRAAPAAMTRLWQTPPGLSVPESALYDAARHVIYVSNMVTTKGEKDGRGFIAKLSPSGAIMAAPWITGLHGPKGMGLRDNRLFVSGIDEIVEIDVDRGVVIARHAVPRAKDLNDITVADDGTVYASDTSQRLVFSLKDGVPEVFVEADDVNCASGILADGDRVLVDGTGGRLLAIDRATRAIKVLFENTGYIDGLVKIDDRRFVVSDWRGTVRLLEAGAAPVVLLDTKPNGVNAADLGWISEEHTLLVPTFADSHVVAYRTEL